MTVQGMSQPLDADTKAGLDEEASFVSEIYYLKNNYSLTPKSIETVDGKEAYVVEVKDTKGKPSTNYYEVATGLKLKSTTSEEGEKGAVIVTTTFADYKEFNGVKVPTHITIDQGPVKSISIKEVKVNSGLKSEDIK